MMDANDHTTVMNGLVNIFRKDYAELYGFFVQFNNVKFKTPHFVDLKDETVINYQKYCYNNIIKSYREGFYNCSDLFNGCSDDIIYSIINEIITGNSPQDIIKTYIIYRFIRYTSVFKDDNTYNLLMIKYDGIKNFINFIYNIVKCVDFDKPLNNNIYDEEEHFYLAPLLVDNIFDNLYNFVK